jgi:hypothetical protein
MTTLTLIAIIAIPSEAPTPPAYMRTTGKPLVMLTWPDGRTETFTLQDHNWGEDLWNWRDGRIPQSLTRRLFRTDLPADTVIHGERAVYVSPKDTGNGTNETGRVMVYEVDYEVPTLSAAFESGC